MKKELTDILERLYQRRTFGIKLGLDTISRMLERMGDPHHDFGVVHVAGTNGKGSVCAILESVLRGMGIKTGMYTSPHLVEINERFRVNGKPIEDDKLLPLLSEIEEVSKSVKDETDVDPTFFECTTALAMKYFSNTGVQIALVETGMGGRLDATNIVIPLVSVITNIALEHQEHLGSDIASIAKEKSGIIKKGHPVVCGMMPDEAMSMVRGIAKDCGSYIVQSNENVSITVLSSDIAGHELHVESQNVSYGKLRAPFAGEFQIENLATALSAFEVLCDVAHIQTNPSDVKNGLLAMKWLGRFQMISDKPPIIIDGAHNPAAAILLASTCKKLLHERPLGMVVGMCADKNIQEYLLCFKGVVDKLWAVPIKNDRSIAPSVIINYAKLMGAEIGDACELTDAVSEAKKWAQANNGVVCVTGSLFLVGEVLQPSVLKNIKA